MSTITIAVAGKGGTGKTTIAALLAKLLAEKGTVLAIDADPSVNLHTALGLELPEAIGNIREELITADHSGVMPPGTSRHDYFAFRIRQALVESVGVDLLAMGRPEGPGCYCAANHVLRTAIDRLADAYDYVVIDNEAGMEHISRQTTRDVNIVLLVSDLTVRGITAAGRAQELLGELRSNTGQVYLVVNRSNGTLPPEIEKEIQAQKLRLLATIPSDSAVAELDARGRPLVELPLNSPARKAVLRIAQELRLAKQDAPPETAAIPVSSRESMEKP